MYRTDSFISADEMKEIFDISKSKAYSLVQKLNKRLKEKGFLTVPARVSRKYFEERFYGRCRKNGKEEVQWLFIRIRSVVSGMCPYYTRTGRGSGAAM